MHIKLFAKIYTNENRKILAVCDEELLGKKLKDKDKQLFVDPKFYGTEKLTEEKVRDLMQRCDVINLVGADSLEIARELGLVEDSSILIVGGVPHLQIMRIY